MEGGDGLEEGLAEGLLPPPPMPPPGPQLSPGELGGLRVVLLPPPPLPPLLPPPPPVLLLPPSQYCEHTSVSSWASLLLLSPAAFGSCWVVPCSRLHPFWGKCFPTPNGWDVLPPVKSVRVA